MENTKHILDKNKHYSIVGNFWIECNDNKFFGPGRIQLLKLIDETGSLNKASKAMKMSYKKAWKMINELNSQTNEPFVILKTGGKEGGGSVLSEEAKYMINYSQNLHKRLQEFLQMETIDLNNHFF